MQLRRRSQRSCAQEEKKKRFTSSIQQTEWLNQTLVSMRHACHEAVCTWDYLETRNDALEQHLPTAHMKTPSWYCRLQSRFVPCVVGGCSSRGRRCIDVAGSDSSGRSACSARCCSGRCCCSALQAVSHAYVCFLLRHHTYETDNQTDRMQQVQMQGWTWQICTPPLQWQHCLLLRWLCRPLRWRQRQQRLRCLSLELTVY